MRMLKLLTTLTILIMTSTSASAEWIKVAKNSGDSYYVDFGNINKKDGYVFFWNLTNYLQLASCFESDLGTVKYSKPLSSKTHYKGDCRMFRYKILNYSWHNDPMGKGIGIVDDTPDKDWTYPEINSVAGKILNSVCKYSN